MISFSVRRAKKDSQPFGWLSFLFASAELVLWSPGYASDERSSLGERPDRRQWQDYLGVPAKPALRGEEKPRHRWNFPLAENVTLWLVL